jgi:hypothetical protein
VLYLNEPPLECEASCGWGAVQTAGDLRLHQQIYTLREVEPGVRRESSLCRLFHHSHIPPFNTTHQERSSSCTMDHSTSTETTPSTRTASFSG